MHTKSPLGHIHGLKCPEGKFSAIPIGNDFEYQIYRNTLNLGSDGHDVVSLHTVNTVPMNYCSRVLTSYLDRIKDLEKIVEDEDYSLNPASKKDFINFIKSDPLVRRGYLVLLDNGNLRAIWKDEKDDHIGLQFLGENMVDYVLFKRRNFWSPVSRVFGCNTVDGITRLIRSFNLDSVLYA